MDQKLKAKLSVKSKWTRLFFMILFLIIAMFVRFIMLFIAVWQFFSALLTDQLNHILLEFSEPLSIYIGQIYRFLNYNTEEKPYPFSHWPETKKTTLLSKNLPKKTTAIPAAKKPKNKK